MSVIAWIKTGLSAELLYFWPGLKPSCEPMPPFQLSWVVLWILLFSQTQNSSHFSLPAALKQSFTNMLFSELNQWGPLRSSGFWDLKAHSSVALYFLYKDLSSITSMSFRVILLSTVIYLILYIFRKCHLCLTFDTWSSFKNPNLFFLVF